MGKDTATYFERMPNRELVTWKVPELNEKLSEASHLQLYHNRFRNV